MIAFLKKSEGSKLLKAERKEKMFFRRTNQVKAKAKKIRNRRRRKR